jgi:hypothetical protein
MLNFPLNFLQKSKKFQQHVKRNHLSENGNVEKIFAKMKMFGQFLLTCKFLQISHVPKS